jgi:pSer/pThr/pTyr-binding forkhead associated (FHA) protein
MSSLSSTITRIGRHSESSLCLISTEHPCLTSRSHAEIHCISDDVNDAKFLLRDTSLNGTYVNDRRVSCQVVLCMLNIF